VANRGIDRFDLDEPIAPELAAIADRLHILHLRVRWAVAGFLWLVSMPIGLWLFRSQLELLRDYFTWAGLRYGLAFQPLAAVLMLLPIAWVTSLLLWQCRNALFGMAEADQHRLLHHGRQILKQGETHPLWRWLPAEH
jgi:hypothetical protein